MDIGFVVAIVVVVIFVALSRLFKSQQSIEIGAPIPGDSTPSKARRSGDYSTEIVGESNYQPALRKIAGKGEVRHECIARIYLEDDNPHDDKAVRIDIDGQTVGYLPRAAARAYRKKGADRATCGALIVGGGRGRSLGVWLDM